MCSSNAQQQDSVELLAQMNEIYKSAVEAVALGDNTLKAAKDTYETLAGFQSQVQQSSQSAHDALATVPAIQEQIVKAIDTVNEAENVSIDRL